MVFPKAATFILLISTCCCIAAAADPNVNIKPVKISVVGHEKVMKNLFQLFRVREPVILCGVSSGAVGAFANHIVDSQASPQILICGQVTCPHNSVPDPGGCNSFKRGQAGGPRGAGCTTYYCKDTQLAVCCSKCDWTDVYCNGCANTVSCNK